MRASSAGIVELFLQLDDLCVIQTYGMDALSYCRTLLWHCADKGIVSEDIALDVRLRHQYGKACPYMGTLPLEAGEHSMGL